MYPEGTNTMFLETIDNKVRSVLFELLPGSLKQIKGFYLAGGTGLALHIGHRKSVDIDLFSIDKFDTDRLSFSVSEIGTITAAEEGTIHAFFGETKVSFLHYPYPLLDNVQVYKGIAVADLKDIACMKVMAVSQRAEKKDFFDLYEIFQKLTPAELGRLMIQKYGDKRINPYHILKSFFYFADAEESLDPVSLRNITWEDVKQYFLKNERSITETFWSLSLS